MRPLIAMILACLVAVAVAGACDPAEPPVAPGTPEPFSSPGVTVDAPPVPMTPYSP